jgi:hypothetical protein
MLLLDDHQIGPVFLGALGLALGGCGVRELVLACRLEPFRERVEKAALGAGGLVLGAVFAASGYRLIEAGLGGGALVQKSDGGRELAIGGAVRRCAATPACRAGSCG